MQNLGNTYTKTFFIAYVKFKFNWNPAVYLVTLLGWGENCFVREGLIIFFICLWSPRVGPSGELGLGLRAGRRISLLGCSVRP